MAGRFLQPPHRWPQRRTDDDLSDFSFSLRRGGQYWPSFQTGPVVRITRQTELHATQLAVSRRLVDYLSVARLGRLPVVPDTWKSGGAGVMGGANCPEYAVDTGVFRRTPHFRRDGDPDAALAGGRRDGGDGDAARCDHRLDPVPLPCVALCGGSVEFFHLAQ